jgi:inorganic pyrophosphatase
MESKSLELAKQFLGKEVEVTFDRPLGTKHPRHGFVYEVNYGFIKGIQAPDGGDLDAYYLGVDMPLETAVGKCVAIVHRLDDDDDKLIVVPEGKEFADEEIMRRVHFQEQWFKSEIIRSSDADALANEAMDRGA